MKRLYLLIILITLSLFSATACHRAQTQQNPDEESGWRPNTPNPLLQYVPQDAPLVLATMRAHTIENPGVQEFMKELGWKERRAVQLLRDEPYGFKNIEYDNHPGDIEYEKELIGAPSPDNPVIEWSHDLLNDLLKDYTSHAAAMGLDPQGKVDAVAYVKDASIVAHISVIDEKRALNRLMKSLHKYQEIVFNSQRYEFDFSEQMINDKTWNVLKMDHIQNQKALAIAAHTENNILTIAFYDPSEPFPAHILLEQKDHFQPQNTIATPDLIGHIDFNKLPSELFSLWAIADLIDDIYIKTHFWYESMDMFYSRHWIKTSHDKAAKDKLDEWCKTQLEYCDYSELSLLRDKYSNPGGYMWEIDLKDDEPCRGKKCKGKIPETKEHKWDRIRHQFLNNYDEAMTRLPLAGTDLMHKLELTGLNDDVCIQEMNDFTKDFGALDWSLGFTPKGTPNLKITQKIASTELFEAIRAMRTEHVDSQNCYPYDDISPRLHLTASIDQKQMEQMAQNKLDVPKSCTQVEAFAKYLNSRIHNIVNIHDLSFLTITYLEHENRLENWLHMRASEETMKFFSENAFGKSATETLEDYESGQLKGQMRIIDHQELFGASEYFDIQSFDLKTRKTDHLIELYANDSTGNTIRELLGPDHILNKFKPQKLHVTLDAEDQALSLTITAQDN